MMNPEITRQVAISFEERRTQRQFEQQRRKEMLIASHPEFSEIETKIRALGSKIMAARLKDDEDAAQKHLHAIKNLEIKRRSRLAALGYPDDYLEIRYDCDKCRDKGYLGHEPCSCFKQAVVDAAFLSFDLKPRAKAENFNTFDLDYYSDKPLKPGEDCPQRRIAGINNLLRDYCAHFGEAPANYLFTGSPGVGKTFMSNCIANELIQQGYNVVYTSAAHLIQIVQKNIFQKDNPAIFEALGSADLLIIDDLGAEYRTNFSGNQLYEIINTRLIADLPMIISTNLTRLEIRDYYDERLSSRIVGNFISLTFLGQDIRLLKKQRIVHSAR